MKPERLESYRNEIRDLRERFGNRLNIWLGAELDYLPTPGVRRFQQDELFWAGFDYFVASVHFLGGRDSSRAFDGTEEEFMAILQDDYRGEIREMTADYYQRLSHVPELPGAVIVGHLDVIKRWNATGTYFNDEEPWYREQVEAALNALKYSGILVELNTAGWRKGLGEPYPAIWILERCRDLGIPVTVSSDSHVPDQLTWGFERAKELLASLRIEPINPSSCITHR
jgi:histidinol-phosphatase (PHP family)